MNPSLSLLLACAVLPLLTLTACSEKKEEKRRAGPPPALITVITAKTGTMEIVEETLGTLEAVIDPKVAAEIPGRVVRVTAGAGKTVKKGELLAVIDGTDIAIQNRADAAETRRAEALLAQQEKLVERQRELAGKGFISANAADDARAQRDALREQLAAARARQDASRRNLGKAEVRAPFDGTIETPIAAVGDYVKVGDPLFLLISNRKLRAHLPFPETAAPRLKRGQPVVLGVPQRPGLEIRATVTDIKPGISESGRALDVIVDIDNDGSLRGGGTVNAGVIVSSRENAVLVPEQSVVLRPAGKVVYVIGEGKAQQRVVETGARRGGQVEILKGLEAGATVALDGAGFLTDNAVVTVGGQSSGDRQGNKPADQPPPSAAPATK